MSAMKNFDVIVIGGGHAGIEAAAAAARMGQQVALITLDVNKIGSMQCNPSVGGLGKGHLAFEVSALGGIMPKLCSQTYLQAKMLNTSKGPAVQGLRLQIDRIAYQRLASQMLAHYQNLSIICAEVAEILFDTYGKIKKLIGILTVAGEKIFASAIVITTGTFLNSAIFVGKQRCYPLQSLTPSSNLLTASIEKLIDLKLGRLKTGTPPRIKKSTVDFAQLEQQPNHQLDYLFEWDSIKSVEKVPCFVTHTTQKTHDIILANLDKAGYCPTRHTKGMEPRYCPSIETKVSRFPDKHSHHVFIEPESLELDEVYPAGISNSLPADIQLQFVRTIPGLEKAELARPGFMIEYDFLQPTNLKLSLEHKQVPGLFFAGQVNGTTGYEEAAGQGIMAGINAALFVQGRDPFILSRQESYIGIMIDDLVNLGVDEPYRMFTSRAERRLILRQDNVFHRLYPYAHQLGLISDDDFQKYKREQDDIDFAFAWIKSVWARSEIFNILNSVVLTDELKDLAKQKIAEYFCSCGRKYNQISSRVVQTLHAMVKYDGYLQREVIEVEKFKKFADEKIPQNFVFDDIPGLSHEMIEKLKKHNPQNVAQAQLIPGMTPAAISILIFRLRQRDKV